MNKQGKVTVSKNPTRTRAKINVATGEKIEEIVLEPGETPLSRALKKKI